MWAQPTVRETRYDEELSSFVTAFDHDPNPGPGRSLVHLAYDLSWCAAAVLGAPLLLWKTLRNPRFRAMVRERRGSAWGRLAPRRPDRPRVLVHGVSVGEVKGARPIVEAIEAAYPGLDVLVTSTTDTGLQVGREIFGEERCLRFPFDPSWIVRRFLRRVQPDFVILIELEIWPNFLRECNRAGIPVAIVNGRITEVSHGQYLFFKKVLPQFNRISLFCVQQGPYAERFERLGVDPRRVMRTGNIKADGLQLGRAEVGRELQRLLGGREGQPVLVAGSTHGTEEALMVRAWRRAAPDARLILVPRHPKRTPEIVRELEGLGVRPQLLSDLRARREEPDPTRPALVDSIGELERILGLADLVFVGGSLVEHGGQNVLEPAAQGLAVITGPHTKNFAQEIALLGEHDALQVVSDGAGLERAVGDLMGDPARREAMGRAGLEAVTREKGAAARTLKALGQLALDQLVHSTD